MTLDETTRMFDVTTDMGGLLIGTVPNSESNGTNTTVGINFNTRHTVVWVFNVITVLVGLVGNVLVFPLMRDAKLYYLSFPVYLRFLSFSDSAVLIIFGIKESLRYFQSYYLIGGNLAVCMLLKFMQYTMTQLSPWLVVGLTLDRFYCVVFPMKRDRLCTRRKATIVCSCLTAVSVVMTIPLMYDIKVVKGRDTICVVSDLLMSYFASVRLVFNSTLPCAMILVLNIVIGIHIQRSAAFRQRFTANTTSTSSHHHHHHQLHRYQHHQHQLRRHQHHQHQLHHHQRWGYRTQAGQFTPSSHADLDIGFRNNCSFGYH
ncbi:somatostatin receptor type 5-like [Gigantopelta aegis]|uniref:somatostatin receptor type 5-like n=1 Tax=Gigantopelta aegis TaxID=1735272 RepID=UPI001B88D3D2|nr:somatostatin receptor type 5-like [Gigantopelta aegis]